MPPPRRSRTLKMRQNIAFTRRYASNRFRYTIPLEAVALMPLKLIL